MRAEIIEQYDRPDHELSHLRGNVQVLPSGNVFVCWSGNSYISEHTRAGDVVLEAHFASTRFSTYRAFKSEFVSTPAEPPIMKSFVYGTNKHTMTTVSYVTWNGATEVKAWNFYADTRWSGTLRYVGSTAKTGFETAFIHEGFAFHVVAEAVDSRGMALGNSTATRAVLPVGYEMSACNGADCDYIAPVPVSYTHLTLPTKRIV